MVCSYLGVKRGRLEVGMEAFGLLLATEVDQFVVQQRGCASDLVG